MTAPTMSVDMRHTKLSAADAALIAGEVTKPSWASRNEGIHERISFDDTLWGFELAGGSFYKTPLRVVYVKPGSRADQACIRKGDTVLRINGIDTSTLTLQEAHDIVLESGIQLKISVTSPDDEEDAYYTYEDPLMDESVIAEQLRKAMEAERIRRALERAQRSCNLPWPWVRRKMIIYRESNCFLVPSKYENKHKEQFPDLPHVRYTDDICEINRGTQIETKKSKPKENGHRANSEDTEKGEHVTDNEDDISSVMDEKEQNKIINEILEEDEEVAKNIPSDVDENTHSDDEPHGETNGEVLGPDNEEDSVIPEDGEKVDEEEELIEEEIRPEDEEKLDEEEKELIEEEVRPENKEKELIEEVEHRLETNVDSEVVEENDSSQIKQEIINTKTNDETSNNDPSTDDEVENVEVELESTSPTSDFINEDEVVKNDDDNVVDGIVGDGEIDSINER